MISIQSLSSTKKFTLRFLVIIFTLIILPAYAVAEISYEVGDLRVFENNDFHIPLEQNQSYDPQETTQTPDSLLKLAKEIHALTQLVEEEGRFLDRLDALYQVTYPVGITRNIGGQNYTIVLDSDEITPEGATLKAYMSFPIPQTGRQLAFIASQVPLTAEGGINGVVELALMFDEPIEMGDNSKLIVYGRDSNTGNYRTKVHFDCNGFVEMTIDAGIQFSPNVFIGEDPETGVQNGEPLTANFVTTVQTWSDMIVSVSLPPFQMKSLKGFGFEVQQATFDFSDLNNPAGIQFPKNYTGLEVYGDLPELWQGFYFRQLVLRLPPELKEGERLEIMAQNMIIDEMGLSGTFATTNLLNLDQGSIGGWDFSIDSVNINLVANSLTDAGMHGQIHMPIMDSTQNMDYSAIIDQSGDFLITASMPESFEVPIFAADMTIDQTSTLTIQKAEGKFEVLANLNGKLSINAPVGDTAKAKKEDPKGFRVDDLKFEKMQIGSADPYFRPGIWSLGEVGYSSANGFSLVLSNVNGFEQGNDVGLQFTTTVKLSGEKYVASTTLKIYATRFDEVDGELVKHKLRYKRTELQDLYISVQDAAISLEGYLAIFKKDPKYGDGYAGSIQANIIGKFGVEVTAIFGEVDSFKYWYADAMVNFEAAPIPLFPGVSLYGIGGGAYQRMRQVAPEGIGLSEASLQKASNKINYIPDKTVFFGFKASVAIGTPSPQGFNAQATLEIVFNQGGGVSEVMFYGEGNLMSEMNMDNSEEAEAPIRANVYIEMDFDNDVFYGNFKVYVNACNGMLTGINPGNLAGEMVIYADKSDWYIHVGRPSARIGLKLEVLGFSIENGSYFMMGTQIEEMPSPPEEVLRILDLPVPDNRNEGELRMARGLAFGTYLSISTGDKNFGIFYASFDMGLGFDVMLSDWGEGATCIETGEQVGMNGWYAEGQVYAFLEGSIGIDIDVFMISIHQEILEIGAAVLLEAKLPNPYWMRGTVGGYYSLLGGRLSGNCRFQLELGQQCTVQSIEQEEVSPVEGLSVIAELSPGDGRSAIDVFSTPQAVFNYQIGSEFSISDDVASPLKYKIVLDDFSVKANGQAIAGNYEWNSRGDVIVFNPRDILPGYTNITLEASVHFEKKSASGWQNVTSSGTIVRERVTSTFETGEAPDYIPESNVAHTYPIDRMMNMYRNEFSAGHISLIQGQEYLFSLDSEWEQYMRFTPVAGGNPIYVNLDYNAGSKQVSHIIPASLGLNAIYKLELVNVPAGSISALDANVSQQGNTTTGVDGDMTKVENIAQYERDELQEKVLFTSHFRTSKYITLAAKLNAAGAIRPIAINAGSSPVVYNLIGQVKTEEPFDKFELVGSESIKPLIKIEASESAAWLSTKQIPFIYDDYPIIPAAIISKRDTSVLGLVPVKALYLNAFNQPYRVLTDAECESGISDFTSIQTYLYYNLSPITFSDFQEIAASLALCTSCSNPRKTEILTNPYPAIMINTTYPVSLNYSIPFIERSGTQSTIPIEF